MWKQNLLRDLFFSAAVTVTYVLEACSGTATPAALQTPTATQPAETVTAGSAWTKKDQPGTASTPTLIQRPALSQATPTGTSSQAPPPTTESTVETQEQTQALPPSPMPAFTPSPVPIATKTLQPTPTNVPVKTYERQFANIATKDNITIAAFYYQWYGSSPGRLHWNEGYKGVPILGEYDSADLDVVNKHIDWATGHGIDAFNFTWWGPGHYTDNNLKKLLAADLIKDIKFLVVYETRGRLKETGVSFDMDDQQNVKKFVDDIDYISKNYFSHPSHIKIDGKSPVFIYLARIMKGDVKAAMEKAMQKVRKNDHDIFLIGDVAYWQDPFEKTQIALSKAFDAVSPYSMYSAEPRITVDFEGQVDAKYKQWKMMTDNNGLTFIPNIMPGYDDRNVRPQANNPPLLRSTKMFLNQLNSAIQMAGKGNKNIISITSFNEWHEYTQIEPSTEYGFDYLRALSDGLGNPVNK